jgi:hypothetical protein
MVYLRARSKELGVEEEKEVGLEWAEKLLPERVLGPEV